MSNYYTSSVLYSALRHIQRIAQSKASRAIAENFGFNPLELSVQAVIATPLISNGFYGANPILLERDGLMHGYHIRARERPDSHSKHYIGPKSEIYRKIHEQRAKPKKAPVWATHRNVGQNGRIKGEGRTRIDFRRLKTLHY